ncbi:MAG: hypothetical protein OXI46_01760 [Gemmatimonadota bacterium]|nr:hypothetical protein [Gemmatimonadota bacterium]
MTPPDDQVRSLGPERSVPEVVACVRAHLLRRAVMAAGLWSIAALGVVLAVAWLAAGPEGWSQGSPGPLLLDLGLAVLALVLAVRLGRGDRGWLAEHRVARAMEDSAGLARGTVRGALQLTREVPAGVSRSLAELAQRTVAVRLSLPPEQLAGPLDTGARGWVRRGAVAVALVAPMVVLLGVSSPNRSRDAWAGLGRPLHTLSRATLPPLQISPGDVEVLRGSAVNVMVRAPGRSEVTLRWRAEGEVAQTETLATEGGEAQFLFPAVGAATEYSAFAPDGTATQGYRIVPVDPLIVRELTLELVFPPHTGRALEAYDRDPPPLTMPIGTRVTIAGRATGPLQAAELEREEDGLRVPLETEGSAFGGRWAPRGGGTYTWRLRDSNGMGAELVPNPLELTITPDSAPQVRFAFPAVDTVLPLTLRQPLVLELRDDYGVSALELVAYRVTVEGLRLPPILQRTELGGTRAALVRPVMDLREWGLLPGDTVRYFARVLDNAPRPSLAETREYALHMPQVAELRRDAQKELEDMADRLAELAGRSRRAGDESRNLEREADARARQSAGPDVGTRAAERDGSLADFEQREQLRQALERQHEMSKEARAARAELESIAEALREAGASDPQLQKDLSELGQLLREATSPELFEQLQEMADGLAQTDSRDARRTLEELAAEQERFREQLQNSLERLRRLAVERNFRAAAEDALELGQRERALADALREGGERAVRERQQAGLSDEARGLQARLSELARSLAELDEEAARASVDEAGRHAETATSAMELTLRTLQQRNESASSAELLERSNTEAARQADRAGEALERTADQLERAWQQMSSQRAAALQRALDRASQEALSLARRQTALGRRMQGSRAEDLTELRGDEAALLQGLRMLADNIMLPAGGPAPQLRDVSAALGEALGAVERTAEALVSARQAPPGPQVAAEDAVHALNRLAISAMMASQPAGDGDDPSQGDVSQRIEQLARQQSQVNNRVSQILPMQLGDGAMGQQLDQLSYGQQRVASGLEYLARHPDAENETLGSLEALAEEARQLAERLAGGRLDPETRMRQDRLFHRLLDAGRMLENDEVSEERRSSAPAAFERGEVLPLEPGALDILRYELPLPEHLQRLSPAERDLVLRYFDRLNMATGRPGLGSAGDPTGPGEALAGGGPE